MSYPTTYDPSSSPKIAEDILSQGKSLAAVTSHFNICKQTFACWRDVHPEFQQAIARGLERGQAHWEEWLEETLMAGTPFNSLAWQNLMRQRYGWDMRLLQLKGLKVGAHEKNVQIVLDEMAILKVTSREAKDLMDVVKSVVEVEQATTLKADVEMLKDLNNGRRD